MAQFEVGKRVICIKAMKTHSHLVKVGDVFKLLGIKLAPCSCGSSLDLDIGLKTRATTLVCASCPTEEPSNGILWFGSAKFAPYEGDELSTLTDHDILFSTIEQQEPCKTH